METLMAIIPTGTWIWKTLDGAPVFESLRILSARKAHLVYLNRRDTLRNKKDMTKASRWIQYNMHLATYITGFRMHCSPRVRGHQCKQLFDWTTHAVNLAKGIMDDELRKQQSICRLCILGALENQIHMTTTCQHAELIIIRKIYKKEIHSIFQLFWQTKLKKSEEWVKPVFVYISLHLWSDADGTADIWNGRWSRNMWYDVLQTTAEESSKQYDFTTFRKWMKILTTKLFETQSAWPYQDTDFG